MKNMTKRTVGLISAILLCTGTTVSAFAEAGQNPYLRGDINRDGAVTVEDAQLALIAYTNTVAGKVTGLHPIQFEAANVLCDSEFDVVDVQCILKYYVENDVSKKTATWDQVTGADQRIIPDTGDELVIRAETNYYDLEVMIRQFVERHPEYKGKVRGEYLAPVDEENIVSFWTPEDWEKYIAEADDTDIFYMGKQLMFGFLNNDDISIPVSALGFTDSDFANMYPYTREIGTSLNGDLKALTATASPSGFVYRTDLAEKYLGVKTPAEMQKLIGTWEDFEKTAKTFHEKSEGKTAFTESGTGMELAVTCHLTEPWFNEKLEYAVPEKLKQAAARYESLYQNGCLSKDFMFSETWSDTVQSDAVFGFFVPSWLLVDPLFDCFCGNEDGSCYGKFNLVQGPAAYHWNDSYLFVSPHCDNKTLAYEFLREFTVNSDTMAAFADETNDFMNNSAVMKKRAASDQGLASLGGQKILGLLDEIAGASHSMKEYMSDSEYGTESFFEEVKEAVETGNPLDELYNRTVFYFY